MAKKYINTGNKDTRSGFGAGLLEAGRKNSNIVALAADLAGSVKMDAFAKELQDLEALFKQTTGKDLPKYYRPPQGIYSQENLQMAKELGYKTVFWSLAYVDWNNDAQPTREQAFAKLIPRTHDGAVVLLHSTSQTNAQIMDELLTKWEEMGYQFETLDELYQSAKN